MNNTFGDGNGNMNQQQYPQYNQQFNQQYQQPKKKMSPRTKKIVLGIAAALVILGSIPHSYGTEGEGVWGTKAVLWEKLSYHVPFVSDNFVGYKDGDTLRVLLFNFNTWNTYADESAKDKLANADT